MSANQNKSKSVFAPPSKKEMDELFGAPSAEEISDADQELFAAPSAKELSQFEEKGILDEALEGIAAAVEWIDSYTGAPSRAAFDSYSKGGTLSEAASKFADQWGEDSDKAPTGPETARDAGISDKPLPRGGSFKGMPLETFQNLKAENTNPSPADVVGLGIDIAADWTLPAAGLLKGANMGLKAITPALAMEEYLKAGKEVLVKGPLELIGKGAQTVTPYADKVAKGLDYMAESSGKAGKAIKRLFSPVVQDDYPDLLRVAIENDIDPGLLPEAVEFGKESIISRLSRSRAEGLMGEEHLQKFVEGRQRVVDALDSRVVEFSGGTPMGADQVGAHLRHSYDRAIDEFFDRMDFTYNAIPKVAPGIQLTEKSLQKVGSKVNGLRRWAKGRIERGITQTIRGQAAQILKGLEAWDRSDGSIKQTVEALKEIGEVAFKSKGSSIDAPVDRKQMQKLYFAIRDGIVDSVRTELGDDVANSLVKNNIEMTELFGKKRGIDKVILNPDVADENVFKRLIVNADSKTIENLKEILDPDDFAAVKGAFFEALAKRNPEGFFPFRSLFNAIRANRVRFERIFTPEEMERILELVKLGDAFGDPILSTSGTGASNIFRDVYSAIRSGVANDALIEALKDSARRGTPIPPEFWDDLPPNLRPHTPVVSEKVTKPFELPQGAKPLLGAKILGGVGLQGGPRRAEEVVKMTKEGSIGQEVKLMGYPSSQLQDVPPELKEDAKAKIDSSDITNIEKAKRRMLLENHGKAVVE